MFKDNLISLRKIHGYSQDELAEKIGVTRQTLSKYETGESLPDIERCKRLADIFGVSMDDLVRNSSILSLSRMRCVRSPTSFESKKWSGIRIILTRKSATSEMLMRVFIYSVIQFLVMPTTTTDNNITNCAIRISVTMFTSRFPIPLSTIACVRNGAT